MKPHRSWALLSFLLVFLGGWSFMATAAPDENPEIEAMSMVRPVPSGLRAKLGPLHEKRQEARKRGDQALLAELDSRIAVPPPDVEGAAGMTIPDHEFPIVIEPSAMGEDLHELDFKEKMLSILSSGGTGEGGFFGEDIQIGYDADDKQLSPSMAFDSEGWLYVAFEDHGDLGNFIRIWKTGNYGKNWTP
ncbi:MAG: hypothetical protein ACYTG7_19665, partial [Planctomycetota bacterium]